ncbi:MAG: hypothetical protein AAB592_05475 [Patescibacteria group bacterium]
MSLETGKTRVPLTQDDVSFLTTFGRDNREQDLGDGEDREVELSSIEFARDGKDLQGKLVLDRTEGIVVIRVGKDRFAVQSGDMVMDGVMHGVAVLNALRLRDSSAASRHVDEDITRGVARVVHDVSSPNAFESRSAAIAPSSDRQRVPGAPPVFGARPEGSIRIEAGAEESAYREWHADAFNQFRLNEIVSKIHPECAIVVNTGEIWCIRINCISINSSTPVYRVVGYGPLKSTPATFDGNRRLTEVPISVLRRITIAVTSRINPSSGGKTWSFNTRVLVGLKP